MMENHFRRTVPLSLLTHPEHESAWPTWAVLAYVHTLDPVTDYKDLYVTYSSTCQYQEDPSDRENLDGFSIDVKRLWIWDWGPVEKDVKSVVFDEGVQVRRPDSSGIPGRVVHPASCTPVDNKELRKALGLEVDAPC